MAPKIYFYLFKCHETRAGKHISRHYLSGRTRTPPVNADRAGSRACIRPPLQDPACLRGGRHDCPNRGPRAGRSAPSRLGLRLDLERDLVNDTIELLRWAIHITSMSARGIRGGLCAQVANIPRHFLLTHVSKTCAGGGTGRLAPAPHSSVNRAFSPESGAVSRAALAGTCRCFGGAPYMMPVSSAGIKMVVFVLTYR